MRKEIRLDEIKKTLLEEKVVACQRRNANPFYITNQYVYKTFKTDSWEEIKIILIKKYPELESYFKEFPTSQELTYALNNNLLEAPKCPYCGKPRSFAFTDMGKPHDEKYKADPYRKYYKTCGSIECSVKSYEDSCLGNLGVRNPSKSPLVKEKKKETSLKNWGTEHPMQNPEVAEKCFQSQIGHYGDWYRRTKEYEEKCRETNLRKRGVEHHTQDPSVIAKSRATQNSHFGGWYSHARNEEWRKKSTETQKRKYGKDWYAQTEEYWRTARRKYVYEGFYFDSSWELGFAIYHIEHNLPIEIHPNPIPYKFEYGGEIEQHFYYPDFKIGDQLIEIKGDHLIDVEGNLNSSPFYKPGKNCTEGKWEHIQIRDKAKTECMKENNVLVLLRGDCKKYIEYAKGAYGGNWAEKFRKLT